MQALPYYKWFWQKWRASREVQRMGYIARGLYRELLDEQWDKGGIPDDVNRLASICDCPLSVMQEEWPKVAPFFSLHRKGLLVNPTLESMRTETDKTRVNRAAAGSKGAINKANGINGNLASVKQLLASASNCHIEEKRREEKIPSPKRKRSEPKHSPDPRHIACKEAIFEYYRAKNKVDPPWEGREGKALGMLLSSDPALDSDRVKELLRNRYRSEVNHGDRPGKWIPSLHSYAQGPIDQFGKPKVLTIKKAVPFSIPKAPGVGLAELP